MNYGNYLKTEHWRDLREAKLLDANYKCQKCKRRSKLQVHHLTYERKWKERLSDLMVLCEACHEKAHELFPSYVDDWKPTKQGATPKPTLVQQPYSMFKCMKPLQGAKVPLAFRFGK